ncbi:MAG: hypothetical protein RPS47_04720 [Colwellia sp.]|jgi:Endonuclease I
MEPEKLTFLCYCDYHGSLNKIANAGCESPGKEAISGNIITVAMIVGWVDGRLERRQLERLLKLTQSEPLNTTIFSDATLMDYTKSLDFTGTMEPIGKYGACRFNLNADKIAYVADGRLGEIARTALYLDDAYQLLMPSKQRERFEAIHRASNPTIREKRRNNLAWKLNKSWNPYVGPSPEKSTYNTQLNQYLSDLINKRRVLSK